MLILSSSGQSAAARTPHDVPDYRAGDALDEDVVDVAASPQERVGEPKRTIEPGSSGALASPQLQRTPRDDAKHERHEQQPDQHGAAPVRPDRRAASARAQPYAPGGQGPMRSPAPREHEAVTEHGGNGNVNGNGAVSSRGAHVVEAQPERGMSSDAPTSGSGLANAEQSDRGERPPVRAEARGEVGPLIDDLRVLFEQDRAAASQGGTTRCGICYLHFSLTDLEYREAEGYYVCRACARALGSIRLPMVRRQQRT